VFSYFIKSNSQSKTVEVVEIGTGATLNLFQGADKKLLASFPINRMIVLSQGKPWSEVPAVLNIERIHKDKEAIIIKAVTDKKVQITMNLKFDENDILRLNITWTNNSGTIFRDTALGILFDLPRPEKEKITLPHNIYNNNPSADPDRLVPHIDKEAGSGYICEEHRLPIPCVNIEWLNDNAYNYLSLFAIPSKIEYEADSDHYWSMGAFRTAENICIAGLSGPLMFNGEKDMVYGAQCTKMPYEEGYFDFAPDMEISKEYAIDWGLNQDEGRGFRNIIQTGYRIFKPKGAPALTDEMMVELKTNAMDGRWFCKDGSAGHLTFGTNNSFGNISGRPLYYLYGWTGQCFKLAWCNAELGYRKNEPDRIEKCIKAVDFYIDNSTANVKGLRYAYYLVDEHKWMGSSWKTDKKLSSRMLGENITDLGDIILLFRKHGWEVPQKWTDALYETAEFLISDKCRIKEGIYPIVWDPDGMPADTMVTAAGIPCVQALVRTYECTGEKKYLDYAEKIFKLYYDIHMKTFEIPFARATMDAKSEDKEAGLYFFLTAYDLYRITGSLTYKEWAEIAADWILTFVYFWNPGFRKGTPCYEAEFVVTGWPGVSVQNHHIDVFFPSYEMWHFGKISGNKLYETMGRTVFEAFSHGMCTKPGEWGFSVPGEQGEQYYQTNYFQGMFTRDVWRGGYNNWNPSWIIAQVLQPGLRFLEK